jgi:hypothetical protein
MIFTSGAGLLAAIAGMGMGQFRIHGVVADAVRQCRGCRVQ